MKRGTHAVALRAVRRDVLPLTSLPPAFQLFSPVYVLRLRRPSDSERPMSDEEKPKRLLPPGVYRITSPVVLEGELTEEQLRALFILVNGAKITVGKDRVVETHAASVDRAEDERDRQLVERVRNLVEAYRDKLGDGPTYLPDSIERWATEFEDDSVIRSAIEETAKAMGRGLSGLETLRGRYEFLKNALSIRRRERGGTE